MPRPVHRTYASVAGDIAFTVIRKSVRNLTLRVRKDEIYVTAPLGTSDEKIRSFVTAHRSWIRKRVERQRAAEGCVFVFGEKYAREDAFAKRASVILCDGVCRVEGKDDAAREKALIAFYKNAVGTVLPRMFAKWQEVTGLKADKVMVTSARTYYGKCEVREKIVRISCRLAAKPVQAIEYVVLHELCHLKITGHQKNFYALVARYMPDYKEREAKLKGI